MKHFAEILEDIKNTGAEIDTLQAEETRLHNEWANLYDLRAKHEKHLSLLDRINETAARTIDLKIARELMRHNAKLALFHDVMPVAVEVWQNYAGKAYGPKTESKIMDEIQQKTGARVCVVTRYEQEEITIYHASMRGYKITCGLGMTSDKKDHLRLLVDNKLTPKPFEAFSVWYEKTTYYDDIPAAVEQMKKLYADVVEKKRELEHACSLFNAYAVEGIDSVYRHTNIYDKINVH